MMTPTTARSWLHVTKKTLYGFARIHEIHEVQSQLQPWCPENPCARLSGDKNDSLSLKTSCFTKQERGAPICVPKIKKSYYVSQKHDYPIISDKFKITKGVKRFERWGLSMEIAMQLKLVLQFGKLVNTNNFNFPNLYNFSLFNHIKQ